MGRVLTLTPVFVTVLVPPGAKGRKKAESDRGVD